MKTYRLLLLVLFLVLAVSCEKKAPEKPMVSHLRQKLTEMEKEYAGYDDKIRRATADAGLRNQLSEEKELLKSRIERIKETLKREAPELMSEGAKEASGGHH